MQAARRRSTSSAASAGSAARCQRRGMGAVRRRTLDVSLLPHFECSMNIWDDNKYNSCNVEENVDINYVINLAVGAAAGRERRRRVLTTSRTARSSSTSSSSSIWSIRTCPTARPRSAARRSTFTVSSAR